MNSERERVERGLAAVLAPDVARLFATDGEDEEGTIAALKAIRRELGDRKVKKHRGALSKPLATGW